MEIRTEQVSEALPLLLGHAVECPDGMVMSAVGLAHIIAKIRAPLEQQLEAALKDVERYRAHIQEAADKHAQVISISSLPQLAQVHQAIREFHLNAIGEPAPLDPLAHEQTK